MSIIPAFDPTRDSPACCLSSVEVISIQHFAFQSREEAFGHGVVEAVTNVPHRGPHAKLLAAPAESDSSVFGGFKRRRLRWRFMGDSQTGQDGGSCIRQVGRARDANDTT